MAYLLQLVENDSEVLCVIHCLRDGSKVVSGGGRAEATVELGRGGVVEGESRVVDGDLRDRPRGAFLVWNQKDTKEIWNPKEKKTFLIDL